MREYPAIGEKIYETVLDNGLRVVTVPREGFSKSYAFFAVNYGGMDVEWIKDGKREQSPEGTAHFLEHKMFDMPYGSADMVLSANGAQANAFTSGDMTAYLFETSGKFMENLETLLTFVTTPYYTPESVGKEMGIISQEIGMCEDEPYWNLNRLLMGCLYNKHRLLHSTVGSVESINRITPETLYACHSAFYVPSNMILCCVGDLDHDSIARLAERIAPKEPGRAAEHIIGDEPSFLKSRSAGKSMEVSRPLAALGFKIEPPKGGYLLNSVLTDLASDALAGTSAPLFNELYASGLINGSFDFGCDLYEGAAFFEARGECDEPRELADKLLCEAERIGKEGLDEAFFSRLKRAGMGGHLKELNSFEMTAWNICDAAFRGEDYLTFPEAYAAVTADMAADFIKNSIREENMAEVVIDPV